MLTVLDGDSVGWASDQPYWHMAEFAIIDRDVFTPLMFTTAGQHIVHVRPPFDRIAAATASQGSPPDIDELDDLAAGRRGTDADYRRHLSLICPSSSAISTRRSWSTDMVRARACRHMLRLRAKRSFYTLYDIVPDARCGRGEPNQPASPAC